MPGNMSGTKRSAHFKWIPVESEDHRSICELFDQADAFLSTGTLEKPARLADGEIHPVWTRKELNVYKDLVAGPSEELEAWIDHWNATSDQHANMDY